MRAVVRALCALCLLVAPLPVSAQEGDAFVLPPGVFRLRGTAELARFDSRFAPAGGSESLAGDLPGPLTSGTFAPLRPLEGELNRFLVEHESALRADPQTFQLGTLELGVSGNVRTVPLSIAAGVLPRLELQLGVPLLREETLFTRFGVSGGTLGTNPAPAANAQLLAGIGEEWAALGRSPVLPTDSSALGRELQRLVQALAPGSALQLPDSAADSEVLAALLPGGPNLASLRPGLRPWRLGDAEATARVRLLSSFGAASVPADTVGWHYRAALSLSARFPTGTGPDSTYLLTYAPDVGLTGFGGGLDGDLFFGRRLWATVSVSYARTQETEVVRRVVAPGEQLASDEAARSVRLTPGDRFALRLAPRYRLTDAVSLGAQYALERVGGSTFRLVDGSGDASVLDTEGGIGQSVGFGARYSTLPAYDEGRRLLPIEVVLGYRRMLDGPAGTPAASTVTLQASLFHRLFGSRE